MATTVKAARRLRADRRGPQGTRGPRPGRAARLALRVAGPEGADPGQGRELSRQDRAAAGPSLRPGRRGVPRARESRTSRDSRRIVIGKGTVFSRFLIEAGASPVGCPELSTARTSSLAPDRATPRPLRSREGPDSLDRIPERGGGFFPLCGWSGVDGGLCRQTSGEKKRLYSHETWIALRQSGFQ